MQEFLSAGPWLPDYGEIEVDKAFAPDRTFSFTKAAMVPIPRPMPTPQLWPGVAVGCTLMIIFIVTLTRFFFWDLLKNPTTRVYISIAPETFHKYAMLLFLTMNI